METSIKQQCWNMWVGDNEQTHRCFSCEKWIVRKTCFQCAYFISEVKGGKYLAENLRPICSGCNNSIDKENLESFKIKNGYIVTGSKKTFTKPYLKWSKA
jgi:hypothetical protein